MSPLPDRTSSSPIHGVPPERPRMFPPSTHPSRTDGSPRPCVPARTLLGAALGSLVLACGFEPTAGILEYALNDRPGKTLDVLAEEVENVEFSTDLKLPGLFTECESGVPVAPTVRQFDGHRRRPQSQDRRPRFCCEVAHFLN